MMSLITSQILFAAAALLAWKSAKQTTVTQWHSLLALLAIIAAFSAGVATAPGPWASSATAAVMAALLWVLVNAWKTMPIAGSLCCTVAALIGLPLLIVAPIESPASAEELSKGTILHIVLASAGFAAFTLAAMQSLAVVWLSSQLKKHQLSNYPGAGSLEHNEQAWLTLTRLAWLAVGAALVSGVPVVVDVFSQHLAHKIFFAVLAWLLLSALLLGRRLKGWRDKTAARWVVGGWLALFVGWLGTKFVLAALAS